MQIFIRDMNGALFTLLVKPSDMVAQLRERILNHPEIAKPQPEHMRILFSDLPDLEDGHSLAYYGVTSECTIRVLRRVLGGAKKGAKRTISKGERMAGLRAKAMYVGTGVTDQATTTLMNQVSAAGYTTWALTQMNFAQVQQLSDTAYDIQRSDKVAEGVEHLLVPQLQTMIDRKKALEKEIESVQAAFNVGFCEAFTNDNGFDTTPFYNMVDSRLEQLQNQAVQEQINAGVQQGIQNMQAAQASAAAASSSGAAPMQEN